MSVFIMNSQDKLQETTLLKYKLNSRGSKMVKIIYQYVIT